MKLFKSLWFIIPTILFALYTLLGFFLVPYLITDILPTQLSKSTNIKGEIQKAKFNPFTFSLDLNNGKFKTKDDKPLFSIDELNIILKPKGLFSKDIKFKAINLINPSVFGNINKKGELNFLHLIDDTNSSPSDQTPSNWNVVIENISIKNGEVTFEDETKKYKTTLANLSYNATDLSTKKGDVSVQKLALTSSSAKKLTWNGDMSLNPLSSKGELKITDLAVNDIWDYSMQEVGIYPKEASLDLDLIYDFKFENDELTLDVKDINIYANKIQMYQKNQKLTTIDNLNIKNALLSLIATKKEQNLNIARVDLNIGNIKLFPSDDLPMQAKLEKLELHDFSLKSDMNQKINGLFKKSKLEGFEFVYSDKNSSIDGNLSSITLEEFALLDSNMKLKKLYLNDINVGKKAFFDMPFWATLKGANINTIELETSKNNLFNLAIEDIKLDDFTFLNKNLPKPVLNIKTFQSLNNTLTDKKYIADQYKIDRLDIDVEFKDGYKLSMLEGLTFLNDVNDSNKSGFEYEIKALTLDNSLVNFADKTLKTPFMQKAFIDAIAKNITSDTSKAISFILNTTSKNLDVKSSGSVIVDPLHIEVDYDILDKDITRNNPYVKEYAKLEFQKGDFQTKGKFIYKNNDISIRANSSIHDVLVNTKDGKKLSSLNRLDVEGIDFSLKGLKLKNVKIDKPKGYINVYKTGKTNISYLFEKESKKQPKPKKSKSEFFVDIDNIKVNSGSFLLKNDKLVKPTTLAITSINSNAKNLYQSKQKVSNIYLEAKVGQSGYLETKGDLILNNMKKNTNLTVNLKDLDLVPLGGYFEQYVGYEVKNGILNTLYTQKIENSLLKGEIETELESFHVGDRVQSKDAINIPLDLALIIMRDINGNVVLDIPIKGDLNDPKFQIGSVVVTAITNIFTNIVSAPFSLLGNILGINGEKLKTVDFKPTQTTLVESQIGKMQQYAKILQKRPDLKLTITGTYDKSVDLNDTVKNDQSKEIDTLLIKLADKRAQTIKQNLIDLDIKEDRITVEKSIAQKVYQGQWIRSKIGVKK